MIFSETIFQTKARVECIWHHESPSFSCVAVDAVLSSSGQRYAHIALFKSFILEASPTPSRGGFFPSSRRPSTSSASSSSSATSFFRRPSFSLRFNEPVPKVEDNLQIQVEGASYRVMDTVYSVDLGSSDNERVELEVCINFIDASIIFVSYFVVSIASIDHNLTNCYYYYYCYHYHYYWCHKCHRI